MQKVTVFIDESGTLPDPKDRVIVLAGVTTEEPNCLVNLLNKIGKKTKLRKKTGEIKYYTSGERTKKLFFDKLKEEKIDIFALVVEKNGKAIPDNAQNFATICWLLIDNIINFYSGKLKLLFDRHFTKKEDINNFNSTLKALSTKELEILHVDSVTDKRVNIADMIAGAILAKETKKEDIYYNAVKQKIINLTILNWAEAKRKFIANKKLA